MNNKTIFITGASSGMGKATAKYFQQKGWNVIATMREPAKEKELIHLENVSLLPLNVTDPKHRRSSYEAATDDKDQITYIATEDARAAYERRLEIGSEASRIEIRKHILGR